MKVSKFSAVAFVGALVTWWPAPAPAGVFPPAQTYDYPGRINITVELVLYGGETVQGFLDGIAYCYHGDPYPYSNPLFAGDEAVDSDILDMPMTGEVGGNPAEMNVRPDPPSVGVIIDNNADPENPFPAVSIFDLFFEIKVYCPPFGHIRLHNKDPLRIQSSIEKIPPDPRKNPYIGLWWMPINGYVPRDPTAEPKNPLPLWLYDELNQPAAKLHSLEKTPEPGTLALLAIGAVLLRRRR